MPSKLVKQFMTIVLPCCSFYASSEKECGTVEEEYLLSAGILELMSTIQSSQPGERNFKLKSFAYFLSLRITGETNIFNHLISSFFIKDFLDETDTI